MSEVRTRFAPSPTGRMHVGNLRTALYAYLIAKHENGTFMLRIEDTDQEREVEGAVDIINRTLEGTGLIADEGPDKPGSVGPYVQSERVKAGIYLEYAKKLVEKGEAYYCFCDKERLESLHQTVGGKDIMIYDKHCLHLSKEEVEANLAAGKPYVIRQNVPNEGTTRFEDEIYGTIEVPNAELDDMVLIKSDGFPTYNFANVVDDHLMGITHVVRGNEYLSSAPKYNRLYEAFGWEVPVYVHCPLITDEQHHKLSKRSGHSSFEDLIEQGFVSEAVVNYVALLGWSPADDREIFSLDELVENFDYHHMSKSPAVFDILFPDIDDMVDFFEKLPDYDLSLYQNKKWKVTPEKSLKVLQDLLPELRSQEEWSNDALYEVLKEYSAAQGVKAGYTIWPVRIAVSGKSVTPAGATEIMEVLGKEESIRRIEEGIRKLQEQS